MLHKEELGDRTPSQFWRHLQALADSSISENILRALWLQRLPLHIQSIVAGHDSNFTIQQLLSIADRVAEVSQPDLMSVTSSTEALTNVAQQVEALSRRLSELELHHRAARFSPSHAHSNFRGRRRVRSRQPRRSTSVTRQPNQCYYHRRFGSEAKRCQPPCAFRQQGNELP
ncbi:hypothetical protein M513_12374, partial [Trichuris suis]